jgi:hypothetical protein
MNKILILGFIVAVFFSYGCINNYATDCNQQGDKEGCNFCESQNLNYHYGGGFSHRVECYNATTHALYIYDRSAIEKIKLGGG